MARSLSPLRTIQSPAKRDFFGVATAGSGDLDGDGYDDILIGAPLAGKGIRNHGMVYAYSGATGDQMLAIPGFGATNYLGRAVAGAGDVNGDGIPDILASGWIQSDLGVAYGRVYVFCGLDGTVLKAVTSFEAGDGFGYTIASLGDLTGDGVPDLLVGQFRDGRIGFYKGSKGEDGRLTFGAHEWLQAGGEDAKIPGVW